MSATQQQPLTELDWLRSRKVLVYLVFALMISVVSALAAPYLGPLALGGGLLIALVAGGFIVHRVGSGDP